MLNREQRGEQVGEEEMGRADVACWVGLRLHGGLDGEVWIFEMAQFLNDSQLGEWNQKNSFLLEHTWLGCHCSSVKPKGKFWHSAEAVPSVVKITEYSAEDNASAEDRSFCRRPNHRSFCKKANINGHYTAFKTKFYLNFQLFDFKVMIFPHKYPVNWILLGQFSSLATKTTEASAVNRTFCPSRTFCKNRRSGLFCRRISAEASAEDHRRSFCRTQLRFNTGFSKPCDWPYGSHCILKWI